MIKEAYFNELKIYIKLNKQDNECGSYQQHSLLNKWKSHNR
mgnify:CR=1 FL=1